MPRKSAVRVYDSVTDFRMERLEFITRLLLSSASASQNARDAIAQGRPWRTDALEDGYTDADKAAALLRELL